MVKPASKPVVTADEKKYRKDLYPDVKVIKNKNILCTSCNGSVKQLIINGKPKTHPFLETLLCEKCNSFFGDGDFSVDEDGSDKYCRWCGQGGTLYLCSSCTAGFCKKCIKRNLPRSALKEVEADDWQCFCCDVRPLYELRAHCWAAHKYVEEHVHKNEGKKQRSRVSSKSDEDSDSDSKNNVRGKPEKRFEESDNEVEEREEEEEEDEDLDKDEDEEPVKKSKKRATKTKKKTTEKKASVERRGRKLKRSSKVYDPIIEKFSETVNDSIKMVNLYKKRIYDCSKKKINANYLNKVENVQETCNKIDKLLNSVEKISSDLRLSTIEFVDSWVKSLNTSMKKENEEKDENKTLNGIDEKESQDDGNLGNESKVSVKSDDENETENKDVKVDETISDEKTLDETVSETINSDLESKDADTCSNVKSTEQDDDKASITEDDLLKNNDANSSSKKRLRVSSDDENAENESSKKAKSDPEDNDN